MQQTVLSIEQKKRILEKLNEGVIFEKFLHTKYIGQKRFSLEGGESTIPALDTIINEAANADVKEVVIGMAWAVTPPTSWSSTNAAIAQNSGRFRS